MKFSKKWLEERLGQKLETEKLVQKLSLSGLEVGAVEPVALPFSGVVVGQVESVKQHPNADKLNVCKVNVGIDELLDIVCGASNVSLGIKVPVAKVGAILPGDFKIKKAKLRGEPSCGMICSEKELGFKDMSDGIWILPEEAPIGEDIHDYLQLDDQTIELDLTPNRGDCASLEGVARDVSALLFDQALVSQSIDEVEITTDESFPVTVEAFDGCPRYCGRVILDVDTKTKTPLWMEERLRRCGLRSISLVVDVTNYVLLELGQPLHAFDLEKLDEKIIVRYAKQGETLTLLDGKEITLNEKELVISDQKKPLALAGVMGGLESSVTGDTKNLFLESAFFEPKVIAGKAREFALHTDSSYRFERGVDSKLQKRALERATALILEIAGGKAGHVIEVKDEAFLLEGRVIEFDPLKVEKLLGVNIPEDRMIAILKALGFQIDTTVAIWKVAVPSYRFDINLYQDLIEEIARVHGFEKIQSKPLCAKMAKTPSKAYLFQRRLRQALQDLGYNEVITYSFISEKEQGRFIARDAQKDELLLQNPITENMSHMRNSIWPGLLQVQKQNRAHQQTRSRLFELGNIYSTGGERLVLSGLISGDRYPRQWGVVSEKVDFFDLKGDLEKLFTLLKMNVRFSPESYKGLTLGQTAGIYLEDALLGRMGVVEGESNSFVFELYLDQLKTRQPEFLQISKFPAIYRDLALAMDKSLEIDKVEELIKKETGDILQKIEIFDRYIGEKMEKNQKSIALGLTFQSTSRTLTVDEIDSLMEKLFSTLHKDLDVMLRT